MSTSTVNTSNTSEVSTSQIPVITVDGPSGSGKGTIGYRLAKFLHWHFLDSGAVYRALALAVIQDHLNPNDESAIEKLCHSLNLRFDGEIYLEGNIVTSQLRSELCSQMASKIAVFPKVRVAVFERLRVFKQLPGLVADGRDMGTVVFPEAVLKIYLEASPEERAKRRFLQLKDTEHNVNLQSLLQEIGERDARDKQRVIAPLKPAEDAVVIDTTGLGVDAVLDYIYTLIKQRSICL